MESVSVAAQRDTYLRQIAHYRENGYNIFYTDESWCGANHSRKYGWIETIQSRSGKRVIILDIGGVNGFVPGCRLCFIGKKGSDDYHNEMNAEHYLKWFQKVLQVLPDKSVIILDQAPYHKMLDPEFRNPTTGWRKQKIIEWLVNRPVPLPQNINEFADLTKNELLQLAKLLCTAAPERQNRRKRPVARSRRRETQHGWIEEMLTQFQSSPLRTI
ncbi:Protein of unknown function [Cotesia congregata]|uniref:Tc1-like transposase DDE domain-containing protein n=1 Tax=Cotesia congregata TaxID=51543 RepID=A0A8J2HC94_COTCN|nr:Protein of unknown function [Cotesia congregata]